MQFHLDRSAQQFVKMFHFDSKQYIVFSFEILRNLMFLIDRNSHYYMYLENRRQVFKDNVRRCLEFLFG